MDPCSTRHKCPVRASERLGKGGFICNMSQMRGAMHNGVYHEALLVHIMLNVAWSWLRIGACPALHPASRFCVLFRAWLRHVHDTS